MVAMPSVLLDSAISVLAYEGVARLQVLLLLEECLENQGHDSEVTS
jgi:hypothetical protein